MKHFVTLFPAARNVHLIKDVGQIPYQMGRYFDYDSTLVCYKNEPNYAYLKSEVEGLNIEFLEDQGKTFFWEKGVIRYLLKNSRSIDVLNLYRLTQASMLYGLIYKWLNPKGIAYLKLDFGLGPYKREGFKFSDNWLKNRFYQLFLKLFMRFVDIISTETREAKAVLGRRNSLFKKRLLYIPNGVDSELINDTGQEPVQKENIILTVGRIGSPVKNHDILLDALANVELKNWRVIFVGPVSESFKSVIDNFFALHQGLQYQLQFTGNITNRSELYSYYSRAKIFCLPSSSEGFPLVLVEALQFGNYIIGTDTISSINEITKDGKLGEIIPADNSRALGQALNKVTQDNFYTSALKNEIHKHSQQYHWQEILDRLDKKITEIEEHLGNDYA